MCTLTKTFHALAKIVSYISLASMLTFCSGSGDDEADKNKYDHSHPKTTDMKKHLFEHEFAQQCIAKKTAITVNNKASQEDLAKQCMCIAIYLFKDLTAKDSYTLLKDKKHAQLLRTKYKEVVGQCL